MAHDTIRGPEAESCYCENRLCATCHGGGCYRPASTVYVCEYIGPICDACAQSMPEGYLYPHPAFLEFLSPLLGRRDGDA